MRETLREADRAEGSWLFPSDKGRLFHCHSMPPQPGGGPSAGGDRSSLPSHRARNGPGEGDSGFRRPFPARRLSRLFRAPCGGEGAGVKAASKFRVLLSGSETRLGLRVPPTVNRLFSLPDGLGGPRREGAVSSGEHRGHALLGIREHWRVLRDGHTSCAAFGPAGLGQPRWEGPSPTPPTGDATPGHAHSTSAPKRCLCV